MPRGGAAGTCGPGGGTSGGAGVTDGRRRDAIFLLMAGAIASAISLVTAFSVMDERANVGQPIAWWKVGVWESSSVVILVVIAPLFMALTRRFEPATRPWPVVLGVHVVAMMVFSLLHVTGMGALRAVVFALVGDAYPALGPLRDFLYEFRKDALVYAGMIGLYILWRRMAPAEAAAPTLDTIEVKDGALRRFIAADEIFWIEAAGNYVELHTAAQAVLHRAPLSDLERQLGSAFVRVHRSRLVRRAAVGQVESRPSGDYVVRLRDGREVAGSRRYRRPLLEP